MDPTVIVALINAGALIVVALIVNRVRKTVEEVRHQTNSMREKLENVARAEGFAEGRKRDEEGSK